MNIGFDISSQNFPRSGVGQYQINLLNALLKIDNKNFYNFYAFNMRNRERLKSVKFTSNNYKTTIIPIFQSATVLWWLLFNFPKLEQVVGECDVYHISEICVQPVKKAKTVAFIHDLTTILYPRYHTKSNIFLHKQRFRNMKKVDAILTNSEHTKKDIIEYLNIKPEKIFVTHLGAGEHFKPLDGALVDPVLQKYNIKRPYILFIGTLEPRKNVQLLIKAFDNLKKRHDLPHQLVLVGGKGWMCEKILKEIESSDYKKDINQPGYVADADLPALMNGADVFVYPSFYEGFGLPILEAMQCGTPVITSNTSSMPEVGGKACLYIDPKDSDWLSHQIYKVISDTNLRKNLSENGIVRAKDFSWEKCARETLKVYESL